MTTGLDRSVLVFDIGGSHISAAICHGGDYRLGSVISASHASVETADAFVDLLHTLGVKVGAVSEDASGAGLAIPGPFDYATGISHMKHKLPYLFGVNVHEALAARFGWEPSDVCSLNDADAFLLGEIGAGAVRGVARVVGLTLGTGIGSAFAVDGHVITSGPGIPPDGEIWNVSYLGGIVEDFVSTRAIQGAYQQRTGTLREVAEIAKDAERDSASAEAFNEFGRNLGQAIRTVLYPFAPHVIVLGGGISQSSPLFLSATLAELQGLDVELRISELREHAALVGAGVRWLETHNGCELAPSAEDQLQADPV